MFLDMHLETKPSASRFPQCAGEQQAILPSDHRLSARHSKSESFRRVGFHLVLAAARLQDAQLFTSHHTRRAQS